MNILAILIAIVSIVVPIFGLVFVKYLTLDTGVLLAISISPCFITLSVFVHMYFILLEKKEGESK